MLGGGGTVPKGKVVVHIQEALGYMAYLGGG